MVLVSLKIWCRGFTTSKSSIECYCDFVLKPNVGDNVYTIQVAYDSRALYTFFLNRSGFRLELVRGDGVTFIPSWKP